jgi:hypothetical protein
MITVKSTINFISQAVPNIIPAVQGDTGRSIEFILADYTIPTGATANYYIQKPSGEAVYNAAEIVNNTVIVNLTAQALAEPCDNYGQVRIFVGDEVVTSFDFILHVAEFRGIDAVESMTEMNIFDKAVEQAEEAINEAKVAVLTDIGNAIADYLDEHPIEAPVSSVNGRTGAVTGLIDAPSSPATGAFLVWNGSAWTAQTLATWQGGAY